MGLRLGKYVRNELRLSEAFPDVHQPHIIGEMPAIEATCDTKFQDLHLLGAQYFRGVQVSCPMGCVDDGWSDEPHGGLMPGQEIGGVWSGPEVVGSTLHPAESPVCESAVHDGMLPPSGGIMVVTQVPGMAMYSGHQDERLAVSSKPNYEHNGSSYQVLRTHIRNGSGVAKFTGQGPRVHLDNHESLNSLGLKNALPGTTFTAVCGPYDPEASMAESSGSSSGLGLGEGEGEGRSLAVTPLAPGVVEGTLLYTPDSPICIAARHSGYISPYKSGDQDVVVSVGWGQDVYFGSDIHGYSSIDSDIRTDRALTFSVPTYFRSNGRTGIIPRETPIGYSRISGERTLVPWPPGSSVYGPPPKEAWDGLLLRASQDQGQGSYSNFQPGETPLVREYSPTEQGISNKGSVIDVSSLEPKRPFPHTASSLVASHVGSQEELHPGATSLSVTSASSSSTSARLDFADASGYLGPDPALNNSSIMPVVHSSAVSVDTVVAFLAACGAAMAACGAVEKVMARVQKNMDQRRDDKEMVGNDEGKVKAKAKAKAESEILVSGAKSKSPQNSATIRRRQCAQHCENAATAILDCIATTWNLTIGALLEDQEEAKKPLVNLGEDYYEATNLEDHVSTSRRCTGEHTPEMTPESRCFGNEAFLTSSDSEQRRHGRKVRPDSMEVDVCQGLRTSVSSSSYSKLTNNIERIRVSSEMETQEVDVESKLSPLRTKMILSSGEELLYGSGYWESREEEEVEEKEKEEEEEVQHHDASLGSGTEEVYYYHTYRKRKVTRSTTSLSLGTHDQHHVEAASCETRLSNIVPLCETRMPAAETLKQPKRNEHHINISDAADEDLQLGGPTLLGVIFPFATLPQASRFVAPSTCLSLPYIVGGVAPLLAIYHAGSFLVLAQTGGLHSILQNSELIHLVSSVLFDLRMVAFAETICKRVCAYGMLDFLGAELAAVFGGLVAESSFGVQAGSWDVVAETAATGGILGINYGAGGLPSLRSIMTWAWIYASLAGGSWSQAAGTACGAFYFALASTSCGFPMCLADVLCPSSASAEESE